MALSEHTVPVETLQIMDGNADGNTDRNTDGYDFDQDNRISRSTKFEIKKSLSLKEGHQEIAPRRGARILISE
jgi:hypothetical protein